MAEVVRRAELRRPAPPRKTSFQDDEEKIVVAGPDDFVYRTEKIFVPHIEAEAFAHAQVWAPHHDDKIFVSHPPQHQQAHSQHSRPHHYAYYPDQKHPTGPDGYPVQYAHPCPPAYAYGDHKQPTTYFDHPAYRDQYPVEKSAHSHRYSISSNPPLSPASSSPELAPSFGSMPYRTRSIADTASISHSSTRSLSQSSHAPSVSAPTLASLLASPVRIGKGDIWNTSSGTAIFTVSRETRHDLSFLSSKPLLAVKRSHNRTAMGYIHFPKQVGSDIMMFVNGQSTKMSHSGLLHPRWEFTSTTAGHDERWHWKRDKISGGVVLSGGKKGAVQLARMKGDLLHIEKASNINEANFDEIVLSAIAIAEAVRRAGKDKDKDAGDRVASMLFADNASIASGARSTLSVLSEGAVSTHSTSSSGSNGSGRTAWSYS